MPWTARAIDADHDLARGIAAMIQGRDNLIPRQGLGVGGDGVFQIQDQGIRRQRAGLFQGPGVGAGHIKHAAPGANGVRHLFLPIARLLPSKDGLFNVVDPDIGPPPHDHFDKLINHGGGGRMHVIIAKTYFQDRPVAFRNGFEFR